jgi:hypothetical protein
MACGIDGGTTLTPFRHILNMKNNDHSNTKGTAVPQITVHPMIAK